MLEINGKQTTMIGSMPQKSAGEALELLKKYPLTIPAWPQLPKRSFKEAMIPQYSEGFPGIRVDENEKKIWVEQNDELMNQMAGFFEHVVAENKDAFSISEEYAAGLNAFLSEYGNITEKFSVVKGQITGPFTFGLGLNDQNGKAVWFDPQYKEVVLKGLTMKALWMIDELKQVGETVLIFFDEPILSALGTPAYMAITDEDVISTLNELINAVQAKGAYVGTHCCGNMDWALLAKTDLDIIAFDAYEFGDKVALYPEEITAFLNRGGILAWGIVPTVSIGDDARIMKESEESLNTRFDVLKKTFLDKNLPAEQLEKQLIITPSCGMGSLIPEASEKVLELLGKVYQ